VAESRLQLVCGEDEYWVAEKAKAVVDTWVPEADRAFGLEIIDGRIDTVDAVVKAVRQCVEAVQTVGFFGGGKTVWLRNAEFLAGGGRSFESDTVKEMIVELTELIKSGIPEGHALLISARSVPRNSALFKVFQKKGTVSDLGSGCKSWEIEKAAKENLGGLLARSGLEMGDGVREAFLARVGVDTRLILQEIEKLSLYRGGPGKVTAEMIEAVTSVGREAEAWDLTDAFGERDPAKLTGALRRLEEQDEAPIKLSAMLDGRVRDLIVLRAALDNRWVSVQGSRAAWQKELPREAEIALTAMTHDLRSQSPFIVAKRVSQAGNYTLNELRAARHHLMELREKLVSTTLDARFLLETTLLKIVGLPKGARKAVTESRARLP
jgi:DNA polymerase III subunit delta